MVPLQPESEVALIVNMVENRSSSVEPELMLLLSQNSILYVTAGINVRLLEMLLDVVMVSVESASINSHAVMMNLLITRFIFNNDEHSWHSYFISIK